MYVKVFFYTAGWTIRHFGVIWNPLSGVCGDEFSGCVQLTHLSIVGILVGCVQAVVIIQRSYCSVNTPTHAKSLAERKEFTPIL